MKRGGAFMCVYIRLPRSLSNLLSGPCVRSFYPSAVRQRQLLISARRSLSRRRAANVNQAPTLTADLSRHSTPNADAALHDRLQPRPHCVRAKHQHRSKRSWCSPRQLFPADARVLPGCAGGSPPASRREPAILSLRAQWVGHVQPPRACTRPPQPGRRGEQGSDRAKLWQ